jgi:predicted TIM-barrel enzyme
MEEDRVEFTKVNMWDYANKISESLLVQDNVIISTYIKKRGFVKNDVYFSGVKISVKHWKNTRCNKTSWAV